VTVAPKALKRARDWIRQLTTRNWGVSMERRIREINRFTVGWTAYFAFADTTLPFEKLEKWLRRRLRQVRWKEWKRPQTRYRNLRALGIPDRDARSWAASQKGYWRVAGSWPLQTALPNAYWHKTMGLKRVHRSLPSFPGMLSEPPGADPHAGWCGRGQGEPGLNPI
jgi:RNA-directed DNA polymerase